MPDVCCYFQVHQPYRLRAFRVFDVGADAPYFDDAQNRALLRRIADRCYIPANTLLAELIERSAGTFRVAMSLSGVLLEQLEHDAPEALDSFRALVDTGGVEILGETYFHSLSSVADVREFTTQVERHRSTVRRLLGAEPRVFRNTELIWSDAIAPVVRQLGFRAVLVEGTERALGGRSPNHVYAAHGQPELRLIPRNYHLSDDIGFRFSDRRWDAYPLSADRYARWLAASEGRSVHLGLDYETFGEHHAPDSGIFELLAALPDACASHGVGFITPSELAERAPAGGLSFSTHASWADSERDLSAWLGGALQRAAHDRLYAMRDAVEATGDDALLERWRRLTTSDHVYYMSTKRYDDGAVHAYFNPHGTPYDAFIAFMNVMQDMERAVSIASAVPSAERPDGLPALSEMDVVG